MDDVSSHFTIPRRRPLLAAALPGAAPCHDHEPDTRVILNTDITLQGNSSTRAPEPEMLSHILFGANFEPHSHLSLSESELVVESASRSDAVYPSTSDEDDVNCDLSDDSRVSFHTNSFERRCYDRVSDSVFELFHASDDMSDSDFPYFVSVSREREIDDCEVDLELRLGFGLVQEVPVGVGRYYPSSPVVSKSSELIGVYSEGSLLLGIDSETDFGQNVVLGGEYYSEFDISDANETIDGISGFHQSNNNDRDFAEREEGQLEGSSIEADGDDHLSICWDDHYRDDGSIAEEESDFDADFEQILQDLEWEIYNEDDFNRALDDAAFGMLDENLNELNGNPPASRSAIENLPLVNLSKECLKDNETSCSICMVDISVDEQVRKLPCQHYFHGDCIILWLGIRNTCPVCRFELPTDDPDYEFMKRESSRQIDDHPMLSEHLFGSDENFPIYFQ